jgi:5-methylcytosine-specific restriction endonuclease McrA
MTRFEEHYSDDAATVEHVYHRRHPKRRDGGKFLPSVVLACRKCNNERGALPAESRGERPVIYAERKRQGR